MKLFGSTKNKITKDENSENMPHIKITDVELFHCNFANNDYQGNSRVSYAFVPNNLFDQFDLQILYVERPLVESFHLLKYDLLIKILIH